MVFILKKQIIYLKILINNVHTGNLKEILPNFDIAFFYRGKSKLL